MGSSQNSAAHLENMRHRRINRMKRQRAIEMGKPVDVSLKPMALNSGQKKELSGLQLHAHDHQKHQIMTPKRVSVMAALGLHLIAVLLGSYYVVKPARLDAETKSGEIVHSICGIGARSLPPLQFSRTPNPVPSGLGCMGGNPSGNFVPTPGYELDSPRRIQLS